MGFLRTMSGWRARFGQRQRNKQIDRTVAPLVEGLEGRRLFAAGYGDWVGPDDTIIDFNGGAVRFTPSGFNFIIVAGTDGDDTIKLSNAPGSGGGIRVELNGLSQVFHHPSGGGIMGIQLWGYGGNDHLEVDMSDADGYGGSSLWSDLHGGDGNDTLVGADCAGYFGRDNLYGDAGNDTLLARAGEDQLEGGLGDDTLHGGAGGDELWGNRAYLPAQPGDALDGGADGDTLEGATEQLPDHWLVNLGGGTVEYKETSYGWGASSTSLQINGGAYVDNDIRVWKDARDNLVVDLNGQRLKVPNASIRPGLSLYVYGGWADDRLHVDLNMTQVNSIFEGTGSISIYGSEGDDVLIGSAWRDTLDGYFGWRNPIFPGNEHDVLYGRGGDDSLHVHGPSAVAYGEGGNDVIDRDPDFTPGVFGTSAGLDGGTGVDTVNGVTDVFDPARDTEPDPIPDPLPVDEDEDDDDGVMGPYEVIELASFVGPLKAEKYAAWVDAIAAVMATASSTSPQSAPLAAGGGTIDWFALAESTDGDEDDPLVTLLD